MSTPKTPAVTNTALADRLSQLTQSVAQHEKAISRSSRTTGTIGLLLLVFMAGYFYYGYVMIRNELLQPDKLVPFAAGMLERNLPSAREALSKQISDSAPGWAASASESAQKGIPDLRVKLENYVLKETDTLLVRAASLTEEKFRKALQENRDVIEKGFKELANDDKLSEASLQALVEAFEQQLQADMRDQSETVLETLRSLSARVRRLAAGKGLDEEERCERRIAMLSRRLQLMEATGEGPSSDKPAVTSGAGKAPEAVTEEKKEVTPETKTDDAK